MQKLVYILQNMCLSNLMPPEQVSYATDGHGNFLFGIHRVFLCDISEKNICSELFSE